MKHSHITSVATGAHTGVVAVAVYDHPADAVWRLVGDLGDRAIVDGFVDAVTVDGEGQGAVRRYELKPELGGGALIEEIIGYDPRRRTYSYVLLDYAALPWADYHGVLRVEARGPDASAVSFESRLLPVGVTAAEAAAVSASNIAAYFVRLDELLATAL